MRTFKAVKVGTNHFEVDLRGWVCPFPKYAVAGLMEKLPARGRLDLLVDCPSAPEDVPKVARELGCVGTEVEVLAPGEWRVAIRT
jgi:TusA-related sulfurtransferase